MNKIMPTKFGQNFLKNNEIVKKIVAAADLNANDLVLEIGPGKGILTEELAKVVGKVVAVELDRKLCELLRSKFSKNKKITIIEDDILKINLQNVISNCKPQGSSYKIVANIPYYITSPILRLFLENEKPPKEMILMVQKEVAERIVARTGQMSILAVSVQYYADAEILFEVERENFEPVPEADSCVIKITNHKQQIINRAQNADFFKFVRAGFSSKRKKLANNLASGLHLDKNLIEEKIKIAGFLPTVRAQELSVENWKDIVKLF